MPAPFLRAGRSHEDDRRCPDSPRPGRTRLRPAFEASGIALIESPKRTKKFFCRYAKTKFRALLGVKRDPDRPYHTSVDSGKVITVVS